MNADKVGIFSEQAHNAGGTAVINGEFTAASSGITSNFDGTMYWGADVEHTFYAYYPYAGSAGSPAATAVPISLATAQIQVSANSSAHIGALDFMIATKATAAQTKTPPPIGNTDVHLRYNHVFTVLEFQIAGTGALQAVKLVGTSTPVAFSGGTINITQATPATGISYTFASQTGTTT